jgi:ABC-2 type transport system ATP-binding protein
VLFSSHVISEVEQVCQRVAVLRAGRLVHTEDVAHLRRKHRIRARVEGAIPAPPDNLAAGIEHLAQQNGTLELDVSGELPPLFGWLATLPIREVQIEPVGLQTVYDRFHSR